MSEWEKSEISLDIPDESNISTSKPVKEENARLLPGDNSTADRKMSYSSLFSFEFYQNLFDVDTDTVLSRIRTSCIPKQNFSFIEGVLQHVQNWLIFFKNQSFFFYFCSLNAMYDQDDDPAPTCTDHSGFA